MANPVSELQAAILTQLRSSEAFSAGVQGRILDADPAEIPCAWVGVTADENDPTTVSLLATVHIWKRSGEAAVAALIEEAKVALAESPEIATASILSWKPVYSEVRLDEQQSAYRGLVRFWAMARQGEDKLSG
ncbi:MAG: DUF3168 domain-containing protein [Rhizobiaceae bacterium]